MNEFEKVAKTLYEKFPTEKARQLLTCWLEDERIVNEDIRCLLATALLNESYAFAGRILSRVLDDEPTLLKRVFPDGEENVEERVEDRKTDEVSILHVDVKPVRTFPEEILTYNMEEIDDIISSMRNREKKELSQDTRIKLKNAIAKFAKGTIVNFEDAINEYVVSGPKHESIERFIAYILNLANSVKNVAHIFVNFDKTIYANVMKKLTLMHISMKSSQDLNVTFKGFLENVYDDGRADNLTFKDIEERVQELTDSILSRLDGHENVRTEDLARCIRLRLNVFDNPPRFDEYKATYENKSIIVSEYRHKRTFGEYTFSPSQDTIKLLDAVEKCSSTECASLLNVWEESLEEDIYTTLGVSGIWLRKLQRLYLKTYTPRTFVETVIIGWKMGLTYEELLDIFLPTKRKYDDSVDSLEEENGKKRKM
jgi:hypothetical protein